MRRCRAASGYESVSATSPGVQTPPLAPAAHRRRAHASITSTNSTANHLRPRLACARSTTRRSPRRSEQPSTAAPPLSGLTYHPIPIGRMGVRHPGARARDVDPKIADVDPSVKIPLRNPIRGGGLEPLWRSAKYLIYLTEQSERTARNRLRLPLVVTAGNNLRGPRSDPTGGAHPISPADMSQAGWGEPIGGMNGVSRRLTEHPIPDVR